MLTLPDPNVLSKDIAPGDGVVDGFAGPRSGGPVTNALPSLTRVRMLVDEQS